MLGEKLMSLGVEEIFGVPAVISLRVPGVVTFEFTVVLTIGFTGKVTICVPSKVVNEIIVDTCSL